MPGDESTPLVAPTAGYLCIRSRGSAVRLTLALLFLSVALKEGSNQTLGAALPGLRSLHTSPRIVAALPGVGSAFYAVGKALSISVNMFHGGRAVLAVSSLLSATGLLIFTVGSPGSLLFGWMLCQLSNALFWACAAKLISRWVDGPLVGRGVAVFTAANDFGAAFFGIIFAVFQASYQDGTGANTLEITFSPFYIMGTLLAANSVVQAVLLRSSATDVGFAPPLKPSQQFGVSEADRSASEAFNALDEGVGKQIAPGGGKGTTELSSSENAAEPDSHHPLNGVQLSTALWTFLCYGRFWLALGMCRQALEGHAGHHPPPSLLPTCPPSPTHLRNSTCTCTTSNLQA